MSSSSQEEYFVIVCKDGSWKSENGELVYERPFVKNFGMEFPVHITKCDDLVNYIKVKAGLENKPNVSLTFQHPEKKYVIDIVDDKDVRRLKKVIQKASDTIYLHLVVNGEVEEGPSQVQYNAVDRLNVVANRSSGNTRGKGSAEHRSSGRGSNNPPVGFMSPNDPQQPSAFEPYVKQVQPIYNSQYTYQQINYGNPEYPLQYPPQNPPEYTSQYPTEYTSHYPPEYTSHYPPEYTSQYPPQCLPQYPIGYSSFPTPMLPYGTPMLPYGMQMLPYPTSMLKYPTTVEAPLEYEQRHKDHIVLHADQVNNPHVLHTQNDDQHVQDTGIEQHVEDVGKNVDANYEVTTEGGSDYDDDKSHFSDPCDGSESEEESSSEEEEDTTEGGSDYGDDNAPIEVRSIPDDPFFGMPQIPECPEADNSNGASMSLNPFDSINIGKCFDNKAKFLTSLGIKSLVRGFQYRTIRSTKTRFQGKCEHEGCSWSISAAQVLGDSMWQVRKLIDQHTCSSVQLNPNHKQATKRVLGHLVAQLLHGNDGRIYRAQDIVQDISSKYNISISYKQAWRAKEYALSLLRGSEEESFGRLPLYCHYLKQCNPGTVTHIQTDEEQRFELVFVAIGCAVQVFIKYLRYAIVVDAAHLKGNFKGTLLLAVAMDGNNQIYPIAYGVCKSECKDTWSLFFKKLHDCIGNVPGEISFISDRAISIAASIAEVFPNAHHGVCGFHLHMNIAVKFGRSVKTKTMFWKLAKAYKVSTFNKLFETLERRNNKLWLYLKEADTKRWARAFFPGLRYNLMTSNSAESTNALSKHARKLPILMLLEFFRQTMQRWFYKRRNVAAQTKTLLTPWADEKVAGRFNKACTWTVHPISNSKFEVIESLSQEKGIVNLHENTCSCLKWQVSGLPCGHVMSVLKHKNFNDCSKLAIRAFHTEYYRETYAPDVNPLPSPSDWLYPEEELQICKPPLMEKRQPGRPKATHRIPSQGEEKKVRRCTRCNTIGHTRRTCSSFAPASKEGTSKRSSKTSKKGSSTNKKAASKKGGKKTSSNMNMASGSRSESQSVCPTADLKEF